MKTPRWYTYQGIRHYKEFFRYRQYQLSYEWHYQNRMFCIEIDHDSEEVVFRHPNKQSCFHQMHTWFQGIVDSGEIKEMRHQGLWVDLHEPNVFKDARAGNMMYHITSLELEEDILQQGLFPRRTPDREVDLASLELDKVKPAWIPDWVQRHEAIYFHPEMPASRIGSRTNPNLLLLATAVREKQSHSWVGSIGVGGFCLFDEAFFENPAWVHAHKQAIETEYGPWYWKDSCSLPDFLCHGKRVKQKNRSSGLDEILVMKPVLPPDILVAGSWDEKGIFRPGKDIHHCLREGKEQAFNQLLQS